jgi:hypothetical protein
MPLRAAAPRARRAFAPLRLIARTGFCVQQADAPIRIEGAAGGDVAAPDEHRRNGRL